MSETKGTVVALDGEYAIVRTDDNGGCGRCHESGGCGSANLGRMFCGTPSTWRVLNLRGASVGEQVRVAVVDGAVTAGAALVYVLPLVLLFAGALVGAALYSEAGSIVGSIAGLVAAWRWIADRQKRRDCDPRFQPHIV
jgi:sigma-E factor negative regulatory protein RseC